MKIACTADIHAHEFKEFATLIGVRWDKESSRYVRDEKGHTMNSRLFYILDALCDMRDYCFQNRIEDMFIAGDLFHHRGSVSTTVLNSVYTVLNSFASYGIVVTMISGNHDQPGESGFQESSIHILGECDSVDVIEEPEAIVLNDISDGQINHVAGVVAIPYHPDKNVVLRAIEKEREKLPDGLKSILLCHLGVSGGIVGSGMRSMSSEYTLNELGDFDYIVVGHYHRPQWLSENAIYPGTPVQNSFSDEYGNGKPNGFFVIDLDGKKPDDIEFIPLTTAPRFITMTPEQFHEAEPEWLAVNHVRVQGEIDDEDGLADELGVRVEVHRTYEPQLRSEITISSSMTDCIDQYAKGMDQETTELGHSILREVTE